MAGDTPVAGAVVTIVGYFDTSGRPAERLPQSSMSPPASAPRSAMTTAGGYFLFRELPAGHYSIAADAFGYLNDTYPPHLIELQNREAPTEVPLRLWKTAAISGRVVDEQGEPVVGVPVTAFRSATSGGNIVLHGFLPAVETDDRGGFRIAPLQPGTYVVGVLSSSLSVPASLAAAIDGAASNRDESWALTSAMLKSGSDVRSGSGQRVGDFVLQRSGAPPVFSPDGRMLTYATTLYPGAVNPGGATLITLQSGEARSGVDVPVRFVPTVEVSGVVTGPDGPMNGLTLQLRPASGATMETLLDPAGVPRAITDARGAFRFLAVAPGSYALRTSFLSQAPPNSGSQDISLWASQALSIGERGIAGLAIALQPGIHVSGRVEFKGATDSPLAQGRRLVVGLRPVGSDEWRSLPGVVRPDGTFTTPGDGPGRYIVFTPDPPGWTLESVSRGGRQAPDDVIELDAADVPDVLLTFSQKSTRVSGSITDANGAPDAGTDVIVFPADTTLWREGILNSRRARMQHATSAATFEASGLAAGDYYLAAVKTQSVTDWQDPSFLERLIPGATKFTLGAGEEKAVPLKTMTPRSR